MDLCFKNVKHRKGLKRTEIQRDIGSGVDTPTHNTQVLQTVIWQNNLPQEGITKDSSFRLSLVTGKKKIKIKKTSGMLETDLKSGIQREKESTVH